LQWYRESRGSCPRVISRHLITSSQNKYPLHIKTKIFFYPLSSEFCFVYYSSICTHVKISISICTQPNSKTVIHFIMLRWLIVWMIHSKLILMYKQEVLAFRIVMKWYLYFQQGRINLSDDPRSGRPSITDLFTPIAFILQERTIWSYRVLARHFRITMVAYLRIFHKSFWLQKIHLH
jgi:hypothetical protein